MSERCAAVIRWSALVSGSYINEERKKNRRNKMIKSGWRCSIEDYQKIMSEIDKR
ncbi:MAG: hypothetical protein J7K81_08350 [Methanophagales archaeon]|nr:hypothetical protein [Methanophagales archaeon]